MQAPHLGPKEQRVYELIVEGLSSQQIAERVGRSLSTIKNQTIRIFRADEVTSREELRVVDHVRKNGPAKPNTGKAKQQRRGPGLEDAAGGRFGSLEARVSALEKAMGLAGDARRCCVVCGGTSQLIRVVKRDLVERGRFVIVCKDFASCRTRVGVVAAR